MKQTIISIFAYAWVYITWNYACLCAVTEWLAPDIVVDLFIGCVFCTSLGFNRLDWLYHHHHNSNRNHHRQHYHHHHHHHNHHYHYHHYYHHHNHHYNLNKEKHTLFWSSSMPVAFQAGVWLFWFACVFIFSALYDHCICFYTYVYILLCFIGNNTIMNLMLSITRQNAYFLNSKGSKYILYTFWKLAFVVIFY